MSRRASLFLLWRSPVKNNTIMSLLSVSTMLYGLTTEFITDSPSYVAANPVAFAATSELLPEGDPLIDVRRLSDIFKVEGSGHTAKIV